MVLFKVIPIVLSTMISSWIGSKGLDTKKAYGRNIKPDLLKIAPRWKLKEEASCEIGEGVSQIEQQELEQEEKDTEKWLEHKIGVVQKPG